MKLFGASCVLLSIMRSAYGGRVSHLRGRKNSNIYRKLQFSDPVKLNTYDQYDLNSAVGKTEYLFSSSSSSSDEKSSEKRGDNDNYKNKKIGKRCKSAREEKSSIKEKKEKNYHGKTEARQSSKARYGENGNKFADETYNKEKKRKKSKKIIWIL